MKGDPFFFFGSSVFNRFDGNNLINSFFYILNLMYPKNLFGSMLHFISMNLGRITCLELGLVLNVNSFFSFSKIQNSLSSLSFLCGVDNFDYSDKSFLVYLGFFKANSFLFNRANVVLPVSAYMERISTFLNLEGRVRLAYKVVIPYKTVLHDVFIINALFFLKKRFFPNNFSKFSSFYNILRFFSSFIDYRCFFNFNLKFLSERLFFLSGFYLQSNFRFDLKLFVYFFSNIIFIFFNDFLLLNTILDKQINNYYSTDIFSRNSKILSLQAINSFGLNFSRFLKR